MSISEISLDGIDFSPEMIRRARELCPGLDFRVGDRRALDLADGALAGIVAFYSMCISNPKSSMR